MPDLHRLLPGREAPTALGEKPWKAISGQPGGRGVFYLTYEHPGPFRTWHGNVDDASFHFPQRFFMTVDAG